MIASAEGAEDPAEQLQRALGKSAAHFHCDACAFYDIARVDEVERFHADLDGGFAVFVDDPACTFSHAWIVHRSRRADPDGCRRAYPGCARERSATTRASSSRVRAVDGEGTGDGLQLVAIKPSSVSSANIDFNLGARDARGV